MATSSAAPSSPVQAVDGGLTISIREYDPSILEAYRILFPDDPDKSPDMLDWRFRDNPHGRAKFAIASSSDGIVGMIAFLPTRLLSSTGEMLGYQAIDTCVHPDGRGKGLFVKMGSLAQNPAALGGPLLWGFPNANAAPGWYRRLGWTNLGPAPLLMRPLRSSFILGRIHRRLRPLDVALVGRSEVAAETYAEGTALGDDFDKLWSRIGSDFGVAVDRGGAFLRWRLFDKPGADYRCVGMKNGPDLEGFVATKVADKHGARLCYVMEAVSLPDKCSDLARLIKSELSRAARSGAEAALAWCPSDAPNYRAYRRAGFLPVPERLRPIEINFGARALDESAAGAAAPDARWFISFLDSDTN